MIIRLECEETRSEPWLYDARTREHAFAMHRNSLEIQLALFSNGNPLLYDSIVMIIVEIKADTAADADAPLVRKILEQHDCDSDFEGANDWKCGTGQLCTVLIPRSEMTMVGDANYRLIVTHVDEYLKHTTYAKGLIRMKEDTASEITLSMAHMIQAEDGEPILSEDGVPLLVENFRGYIEPDLP